MFRVPLAGVSWRAVPQPLLSNRGGTAMPFIVQRDDPDREYFEIYEGKQYVGRIYKTPIGSWYWSVDLLLIAGKKSIDGHAATRTNALADLKDAWMKVAETVT